MLLTDGYLEPYGRCEYCGRMTLEAELVEFDGNLLCPDDLETVSASYDMSW
jgi:formylmethanofuran dehydrogenase subunit E